MSLYRVHFKWKEKEVELMAKSLDLTHPYFVSIKGLVFPKEPRLVINPLEEEVRKTFGGADHLMIPFQTVSLIEELPDNAPARVVPFELVEAPDSPEEPRDLEPGEEQAERKRSGADGIDQEPATE